MAYYQKSKLTQTCVLSKFSKFHIDSFNHVVKKLLSKACMALEPVYVETDPCIKISVSNAEMAQLQFSINARHHTETIHPSEARMRQTTYLAELNLTLLFEMNSRMEYCCRTFFIPLMVKSDLCHLSELDSEGLIKVKEDVSDPGGYFIIKGKERLIRLFAVQKRNYPLAVSKSSWKNLGDNYSEYGISIRSVRDEHQFSNVYLHFLTNGTMNVRLFYKTYPYHIPVMLILRALTDLSDMSVIEDILNYIHPSHRNYSKKCLMTMLRVLHEENINTREDAKYYFGNLFSVVFKNKPHSSNVEISDWIFSKIVLIHLETHEDKYRYLCFCIGKLFHFMENKCAEEDIDNPIYQEVLSPGQVYLIALKESISKFLSSVKAIVSRNACDFKLKKGELKKFCNKALSITPDMKAMIATGNIPGKKYGLPSETGYTVLLERTNIYALLSQFTTVCKFSMLFYGKNMRKYYPESWGFICPTETPEGENVGLHNHLASACEIVSLNARQVQETYLYKMGLIPLDDPCINANHLKYFIYVDGKILGWIYDVHLSNFITNLKLMRTAQSEAIPDHSEIVFSSNQNLRLFSPGVYIFSLPCRMIRKQNTSVGENTLMGNMEQQFPFYDHKGLNSALLKEPFSANFLSTAAAVIPFSENNSAVRNIFSSVKIKQAVGVPFYNILYRSDVKIPHILYPQSPIISTKLYEDYCFDNYPVGTNTIVAVMSYAGFDMEDALVLNKASVERGLMQDVVYESIVYDFGDLADECSCSVSELQFGRNINDPSISAYLDKDGLPYVGTMVKYGTPVLSIYSKGSNKWKIKKYNRKMKAQILSVRFMGELPESKEKKIPLEKKKVAITFCIKRQPEVGDKFNTRHGQKGICSTLMHSEDMPFTNSGLVPDIIFNPHGLPSRMSVGMMLEIAASKVSCLKKCCYVINPFQFPHNKPAAECFGTALKEAGLNFYGTETFYSGTSGEELKADIFCGPLYYLRLHHVVEEKYQVNSVSGIDEKTFQPVNPNKSGAVRFGEMERDSALSYGATEIILDRLLYNSDKCFAFVCSGCLTMMYPVQQHQLPGQKDSFQEEVNCQICDSNNSFKVKIPYVLVYLIAELSTVNIKVKLCT